MLFQCSRAFLPGRLLWLGTVFVYFVDIIWFWLSERISIQEELKSSLLVVSISAVILGIGRGFDWAVTRNRLYDVVLILLFVLSAFMGLRLLNYALMSIPLPLADDLLNNLDLAMGLQWLKYANLMTASPFVVTVLRICYQGLIFISLATLGTLFILDANKRASEYLHLFFLNGLIITVLGSAFPAHGTVARFASHSLSNAMGPGAGTYHIAILGNLRSNGVFIFGEGTTPGLIEFPSFHTNAAILIAYAFRGMGPLFLIALAYAICMIAATPLMGGHYFVDLLAGGLLAVSSCFLMRHFENEGWLR